MTKKETIELLDRFEKYIVFKYNLMEQPMMFKEQYESFKDFMKDCITSEE